MLTSRRKIEHLDICLKEDVESYGNGFEDVHLLHRCLPGLNKSDISTDTIFLGHKFDSPFMIASMTGGHPETKKVNANLAIAAEALGIGIGVGSQRAAIEDPTLEDSYRVVRDNAPTAFIYGNIGAPQLLKYGVDDLERAVEMIDADAIAIHLNFLQEAIQPEGEVDARGCLEKISEVVKSLSVPVIAKETGAGICRVDANALKMAGVSAIDVGGKGGTSWAGVEVYRARAKSDKLGEHLGMKFWNWGISTVTSLVEANVGLPLISTGGIRDGIMAAKSLALGSSLASVALPLVPSATVSSDKVIQQMKIYIEELKATMFLTGSSSIVDLKNVPAVITGTTHDYLKERGFDCTSFARR